MDCGKAIASKKSVPPPEIGTSATSESAAQEPLPRPIRTRRSGSRSRRSAVVGIEVGQLSEPREPEKAGTDLPPKKKICKEAASALASAGTGSGGVIHSFDLNKLPNPEDEEDM